MGKLDDLKRLGEQKRLARSSAVERFAVNEDVGGSSPPVPAKIKTGRPLAKDADKTLMATKPWEAEGMSRRTWYRRQKKAKQ
jgi:hypothetical protein